MLSPTRFFEIYNACMLHFKEGSSYDYFKYAGKTSVKEDTLLRRKDKQFFTRGAFRAGTEETAIIFMFTNFIFGNKYILKFDWKLYTAFIAYRDALFYRTKQDLDKYRVECPINTLISGDMAPLYYVLIMDTITNGKMFLRYDEKFGADDVLWSDLKKRLNKAKPFIVYYMTLDKDTCQNLRNYLKNSS